MGKSSLSHAFYLYKRTSGIKGDAGFSLIAVLRVVKWGKRDS